MKEKSFSRLERNQVRQAKEAWLENQPNDPDLEEIVKFLQGVDLKVAVFASAFETAVDEAKEDEQLIAQIMFKRGVKNLRPQYHRFDENMEKLARYIATHKETDLEPLKDLYNEMVFIQAYLNDILAAENMSKEDLITFFRLQLPELIEKFRECSDKIGRNPLYLYYRSNQNHKERQEKLKVDNKKI